MSATTVRLLCGVCGAHLEAPIADPTDTAELVDVLARLHAPGSTCAGRWAAMLCWPNGAETWLEVDPARVAGEDGP